MTLEQRLTLRWERKKQYAVEYRKNNKAKIAASNKVYNARRRKER
jgi:hypothetical protein